MQLVLIVVVMMGLAIAAVVEYSIVEEFCVLLMAAETEFDERFTTTS